MLSLKRTDSGNKDFVNLVSKLDEYLHEKDGEQHGFYAQYNKIDKIKNVIVAYDDSTAIGCGAIKEYDSGTMEVKRMYVKPEYRGRRIGRRILDELENWAIELNYKKCILETGRKQPEAVRLYTNSGYTVIPNYGQYKNVENSICFEKEIDKRNN